MTRITAFAMLLVATLAARAHAGTASGSLTVETHVAEATCSVGKGADLAFPDYTGAGASGHGQLLVVCTDKRVVTIELGHGQAWDGSNRRMRDATSTYDIGYVLYQDPGHSVLWQDSSTKSVDVNTDGVSVDVYGAAIGGASVPPATTLTDLVEVTVTF